MTKFNFRPHFSTKGLRPERSVTASVDIRNQL
jgi:hypothetical protein